MIKQLVANLYNPHEQSKEQLIESFVVRCNLFNELFREIKAAAMKYPEQHYLIEGQRGSGKTTLLLRLSYEIENDPELNTRLIPVVFKEEAYYGITRLFNLWEAIARELETKNAAFTGLRGRMTSAYHKDTDYERVCFTMLIEALEGKDTAGKPTAPAKKFILFVDNIGEMFLNFTDQECHRLREILMTCPHLRLIGATSVVLEASFKYEHAFYEFFKKKHLEGLKKEETSALLLQLAKIHHQEDAIHRIIKQQPGRVETFRILTGGVIRTIVLLFEIFIDNKNGNAITDLELVLDRVTPLYQHRMADLKPLQREVVDAIALNWDAISAEEIANKTRRTMDEVTMILGELTRVFIIQRAATDVQSNLYYLQERFFNIWYLMRLAPKDSQSKVIWLVRFLECWYSPQELHQRAQRLIKSVSKGYYQPKAAYYLTEALARTGKLDIDLEHRMKLETRKLLHEKDTELLASLSPSDKELFEEANQYHETNEYKKAIDSLLKIKNKDEIICNNLGYARQFDMKATEEVENLKLNALAWMLCERKINKEDALKFILKSIELVGENSYNRYILAWIYLWHNRIDKALELTDKILVDPEMIEDLEKKYSNFVMLLLAKNQYQYLTVYFDDPNLNLSERFKPLYYALLYFSNDQNYNKMPPELAEPVEDIIKQVKQMMEDYK